MPHSPTSGFDRFLAQVELRISRVVPRVSAFWQRVTEGIELQQLWGQFMSEARLSYSLYSREVDWKALENEKESTRAIRIGRAFFWAMVMKLSPARRVFLLIAFALIILALFNIRINFGKDFNIEWSGQLFFIFAAAALVLLLALELADRVTMKRDLEIAREIQRHLVPAEPPRVPGFDIAFATRPANTVAGDYYDAFLRVTHSATPDARRLMIAVADVAGKGVPAALVMATFQASLRTLALEPTSLSSLVTGLNHYACAHGVGGQRFITGFLAEIDTGTRSLAYINAGHNQPILRRASGEIERLNVGGLPFGIMVDAVTSPAASHLVPGIFLSSSPMGWWRPSMSQGKSSMTRDSSKCSKLHPPAARPTA
jgi:phosphoserine phosphatase RsbU/P